MAKYMNMLDEFKDKMIKGGNDVVITEGVMSFFKSETKPEIRELDTTLGKNEISSIEQRYPWLIKTVIGILKDEAEQALRRKREASDVPASDIEGRLRSASSLAPDNQRLSGSILSALAEKLALAVKYNGSSVLDNAPSFARSHVASAFQTIVDRIKRNTPSYMAISSRSLNEADFSGIASSIVCESIDEDSKSRKTWKGHNESYGKDRKLLAYRLTANGRARGVLAEGAYPILHAVVKCRCPTCNSAIDPDIDFTGAKALDEFKISGLCEECQDKVFD
jgi:hypothetical protein